MALTTMVLNPLDYFDYTEEADTYQIATDIYVSLLEDWPLVNIMRDGVCNLDYNVDETPPRTGRHHQSPHFPLSIDLENAIDKARTIEKALRINSQNFITLRGEVQFTFTLTGKDYLTLSTRPINQPLRILSRLAPCLRALHDARKDTWERNHQSALVTFADFRVPSIP
jgi:hypothetical protein